MFFFASGFVAVEFLLNEGWHPVQLNFLRHILVVLILVPIWIYFDSLDALLKESDAIIIAVPTTEHFKIAKEFNVKKHYTKKSVELKLLQLWSHQHFRNKYLFHRGILL